MAEVPKSQKQMQHLIGMLQNLHAELKQEVEKFQQLKERIDDLE